jgi:hypothetical protein
MAAALVIALVVFVLVWFEPQKLFIDERVEDPLPTAAPEPAAQATPSTTTATPSPTTDTPTTTTAEPAVPIDVARGTFISRGHGTSGTVRVLDVGDGTSVVRLEGLATDNGPDLYLYLTANPAAGDEGAFDDDHVNLGRLKGNLGDQNYDLPAGTDLTRYRTVVIWCDRFNSAFGAADLTATP